MCFSNDVKDLALRPKETWVLIKTRIHQRLKTTTTKKKPSEITFLIRHSQTCIYKDWLPTQFYLHSLLDAVSKAASKLFDLSAAENFQEQGRANKATKRTKQGSSAFVMDSAHLQSSSFCKWSVHLLLLKRRSTVTRKIEVVQAGHVCKRSIVKVVFCRCLWGFCSPSPTSKNSGRLVCFQVKTACSNSHSFQRI